jgi:hypothetical protein
MRPLSQALPEWGFEGPIPWDAGPVTDWAAIT